MLVEKLHDPSGDAVEKFVFHVLSSIVKEDRVLPALTNVALISWRDLPTRYIELVE